MFDLESIKPVIATTLLALYLPVPIYLLLLHGLHGTWKRMGLPSYGILLTVYGACVLAVVWAHPMWSWHAWPWPNGIAWVGVAPLALSGWLAYITYRTIPPLTLHLVDQLRPGDRRIIRHGILGTIRHPRYVMFSLIALGNAWISGYPLAAASLIVTVALFALVIRWEERELLIYFGEDYERYRRTVPAFIPRRKPAVTPFSNTSKG